MARAILGKTLQQHLVDSGVLPELCRRVVIDIPCNGAISIYYESYGSTKLLELDLPRYLRNAVRINVEEMDTNAKPDFDIQPLEPDIVTEGCKIPKRK